MMRHRVANPIIFVDEIEKSQASHHGDPLTALLMLLEPQTAKMFHDPFLQFEADLSHVVWFAGANSLRGLPAPILSRFCIVEVDAPDGRDWPVVRSVLAREIEAAYGLPADSLPPIDPQVDEMLATLLDRRRDLRVLRRTFEQVIGAALEENAALPN
jgi:ATP-dependent Lon protease